MAKDDPRNKKGSYNFGAASAAWFGGSDVRGRLAEPTSSGPSGYLLGPGGRTAYGGNDHFNIANLGPEKFTSIQVALMESGYADKLRLGVWDEKSAKAMKSLMTDANRSGVDWMNQLSAAKAGAEATEAAGGGKQEKLTERPQLMQGGGTFMFTNPVDVAAQMRTAFSDALGRNPSPEEELRFIDSMKNQELFAQQADQNQKDYVQRVANMAGNQVLNEKIAAQGAIEGGTDVTVGGQTHTLQNAMITRPADPGAQAEWIARTRLPNEYHAQQVNKRWNDIMNMVRSSSPGGMRL